MLTPKQSYKQPKPLGNKTDFKEITVSLKLALKRRKDVMNLLTRLEEAWKEAAGPHIALNKPLAGSELSKDDKRKKVLLLAAKKKRKIEELQQKIFLSFQHLTNTAHNNQLTLGKEILTNISKNKNDWDAEVTKTTELIEAFFKNENSLNKAFLSSMKQLKKKTDHYLEEAKAIKMMKCSDKLLQKFLKEEVYVLEKFLRGIKDIFKK